MIFTQEQINEIKQRLAISGSKDPQLSIADLPLTGEETIALVQQGENKRVSIEEFYEEFSQYIDGSERVDFFNVSRYAQRISEAEASVPLTLSEAVELCPEDVRRGGQTITFVDTEGNWALWQYKGTTPDNWTDTDSSWLNIESDPNLGIIFTISDTSINVGETKDIYLHFETSDGGEANVVQVLLNGEVLKTYKKVSSFDLHQEVSKESEFTVKAYQYGYEYEKTHTVLVSYPAWIGAGQTYLDITNDDHKFEVTNTVNGSYNVIFPATSYFIIMVPKSLVLGPITMSSFDVPMQATSTQKIGGINYTVYMSANQYVAGTHTFVIGTYSGSEKELVENIQQDVAGLQTLVGEQEEINQQQSGDVSELQGKVQSLEREGLNTADEEDITLVNQKYRFADKAYSELDFSGMARTYLRKHIVDITKVDGNVTVVTKKNLLIQEMIEDTNTIYVLQYDYDLNGTTITIPENCIIKFEGGSISNGTIVGNNTILTYYQNTIFNNITLSGTFIDKTVVLIPHGDTRPTGLSIKDAGYQFFDTSLLRPIYWNGFKWVDSNGYTAVRRSGSTEQRPAVSVLSTNDAGLTYYNTKQSTMQVFNGSDWVNL